MAAQPSRFKWVRDEDFVVTVYDLRVVNPTTHTKASSQNGAEITALDPGGISLKVPRELCNLGHVLSLEVAFRRMRPEDKAKKPVPAPKKGAKPKPPGTTIAKLVTTGKVTGMFLAARGQMEISVKFYQYDEQAWEAFCEEHSRRQLRVSAIFKRRQD